MLDGKPRICQCKKGTSIVCEDCNQATISVAVIALTRIGLDRPEERYLKVLSRMMEVSQFKGVIGGKPKKALYFLGRHNQDYVYLDPHFVQNA